MNPECQQGKHANCDGNAWDDEADQVKPCGCPCHTINHGTYGGWQTHRNRGVPACDECREANNAYMRQQRMTPTFKRREAQARAAYLRALRRLEAEHPDEYQSYYAEELGRIRGVA